MVSENDEETEKHNKTDHKANTQKTKTFTQINSVIDTSCTKLQELFSCQKVAHSVIFYVIIFLLLLVLVYIFRKLVSLPNSNGRYHGRKHNASSTTTGSQNPDNASMSKGFPTKWPKPNTVLTKYPDNVPISSDFSSARETKTHIYNAPENGWQKHEYSDNNNNFNSLENSRNYKYTLKNPAVNSYSSSSFNNNFLKGKKQNDKQQASNDLHAVNWKTSNYVSSHQYGKTPSESSGTSFRSSSGYGNKQYDWSSQENSGFAQPDSSWKTSWSSEPWDMSSNLQSWPYSGSSGSGVRKINQESQDVRSKYHSFTGPTSLANNYAWGSWAKWSQPGSGFGWVKATDYNKENSYKSMTTPNWNNYYYDNASGKWNFNNNQNTNAYYNSQFGKKQGTSNLYHADSTEISAPSSWNPYAEYWNQTQGWGDFDATNSNAALAINTRERLDLGNHQIFADNGIKSFQVTGNSALHDYNVDHRWPLEDNREDEVPKPLSSTFIFHKGKNSKGSRAKIASHKISNLHKLKKIRKKKKHAKFVKFVKKKKKVIKEHELGNVKKSYTPHPTNSESIKKGGLIRKKKLPRISSKHITQKVSRKKKRVFKLRHSKLKKHSTTSIPHKDRKIGNKQNHFVGKWKRKVHHVKHCKNLQSFKSNGKVKLDKKYLQKQRTYKYTVLSCRYIHIRNRRKIHRRHLDDDDVDDVNEDNGDEDEKPLKRKQICRKFWFITNGKILLKKTTKNSGLRSYKVLLCRKKDEPQMRNHAKIRTVSHHHHYTPPQLDDDDDNIDNSRLENEKNNHDFGNEAKDQEDNGSKDRIEKLARHQTHKKVEGYPTDDTYSEDEDTYNEDDDSENELIQTRKPKIENIKKNHDNDDEDNDNFEGDTLNDIDDDIDIDTTSKHTSTSKHIVENDDEKMAGNKQQNSDENDNDFFAESSAKKRPSDRKIGKSKYNNRHMKISEPDKTNLSQDDIDDIDDVDDNISSGHPEGSDERQRPVDDVAADDDDELDSNRFDGDLDDDIDIMDTDHTTSHPKPTISSRLRKVKNKHQSITHKSGDTKQGSDKRGNVYERLLLELTKDKDTKDEGNDPKRLLASILKRKVDSVRVPKHATSKILHTKYPDLESKRKDKEQTDNEIRPALKNMLINSLGLSSLSQVTKAKQPNKITLTTPRPNRKQFIKDILKEFSDQTSQTWRKPTGFTTQKPTVALTSEEQMKIQFAKLLKKIGIKTSVPPKTFTAEGSSTTHKKNLPNDIGDKIQMHNAASTVSSGPDVMSNKPSLPTPHLSPLPSPPPLKLLPPPPRLPAPEQLSQQRQKQPKQSQLLLSPLSLQPQQKVSTASTNVPNLNQERDQKQFNVLRSYIPTIKPQQPDQISQAASFPEPQQQIKNPRYSYSSYSSNNNDPYSSSQTQRTINVLCFGDSLTSGFYNHGRGKHPYSIKLNQLLNPQGSHRYHIETRGVVGEMVHGSMTKRLPKVLNEGTHYDWVLILGGTNDVAHVKNFGDDQDFTRQLISVWSPKIVKDIEKLHEIARSYGSRTVLMTIPETAYELWPDFISIRNMRLSVNAALRKYATEVRDTTVLCDLAYKLPRSTLSHEMEKLYWNDHIHLNPVGYNKMAEVIQQCIQPYLS